MEFKDVPLWIIAFLISGSWHEYAHAYMAFRFGDDTAARMGRLTLNPIAHIDPTGLIFLIIMSLSGFGIGWMKPVPINFYNLRNPRRDGLFIALMGPVSNIILAVPFAIIIKLNPHILQMPMGRLVEVFLMLNVLLAAFNIIPIYPLDGSHVVEGLLPEKMVEGWQKIQRYGFIILIILLFTGMLGVIMMPIQIFILTILGLH
ncbi:MAG: site-2 protease family protein [bacterium]|nr:site-2 protease family protein [bacterium]